MNILDAIDGRVSARKLTEPGPTPEQLDRLLRAGVRAPDHGQLAPWRFVVIAGAARTRLGAAMADIRRRADPDSTPDALESEAAKALRAPVILAVAAEPRANGKVPEIEQIAAVAACVQNVILAANALGFAANWKTGAAAYDPAVKRLLGFSDAATIVALLYIGTPVAAATPRPPVLDGVVRVL